MGKVLKSILLIDDNEATNFLHQVTIKKAGCAEHLHIVTDGQEALQYLTSAFEGKHPRPDLIFLDINMPVMDGWEFLEAYRKLSDEHKAKTVILMLTTSLNPDDVEKSKKIPEVSGYLSKPLTVEMLHQVLNEYF